jgi:hypothetical protein
MYETQKIIVRTGEVSWCHTEQLMHPGVPEHRSAGQIAIKGTHSRRFQGEIKSFK